MKQKRIAAAVVMVCMVLLALPLGVNRSLTKLREEAENSYYYDSTGFAVYSGIDAREDAASNMLTVAKRYTEENEKLEPLINELDRVIKVSQNTTYGDFGEEAEANLRLGDAAQVLFEELEKTQLSETDKKYPGQLMAQMKSQQDMIVRSSYNDDARAFNERLERFPVNFLKYAAFVKPLGVFEEN